MTDQKTVNNSPAEKIAPSGDLVVITPTDAVEFTHFTKGIILLNGDGTLSAIGSNGVAVIITAGLQTGVVYPFELQEILDTGTGATLVLGLF